MEVNILFVLCLCTVVAAKSVGKESDVNDLPNLPEIKDERKDLLPKYSGGDTEYDIKLAPMEFNINGRCFIFCKNRQTTTTSPLIFPEGDTWWQREVQETVKHDKNLDHFPILKQTFENDSFRRNKKKDDSALDKVGKHIALIFRPFTNLVMGWF